MPYWLQMLNSNEKPRFWHVHLERKLLVSTLPYYRKIIGSINMINSRLILKKTKQNQMVNIYCRNNIKMIFNKLEIDLFHL